MEVTFVKTLSTKNSVNFTHCSTLTSQSLTYHIILTCRRKVLQWRPTKTHPIAIYRAEQCVLPTSLTKLVILASVSGLTQKNSFRYLIVIGFDIDAYTAHY